MLCCQRHLSLLLGSGDDGGVISNPTTATKCSNVPGLLQSQALWSPIQVVNAIYVFLTS